MRKRGIFVFVLIGLFVICALVYAIPPTLNNGGQSFNPVEDQVFTYNFSQNVTNPTSNMTYSIENITSTLHGSGRSVSFYTWFILNSTTGVLTVNSTNFNQTENYTVGIKVANNATPAEFSSSNFFFVINSTNDAPTFTNLINRNFSALSPFSYIVSATDEENNVPFTFNVTFLGCNTLYSRPNCTLFSVSQYNSTSLLINFTPTRNDSGNYTINFTVSDNVTSPASSSQVVNFTVLDYNPPPVFNFSCGSLVSEYENNYPSCWINVSDINELHNITLTSNYSWFVFNSTGTNSITLNTTNGSASALIAFTPGDSQVGTWHVNVTARDTDPVVGINSTIISFSILNVPDNPLINTTVQITSGAVHSGNDINVSENSNANIQLWVYDDDFKTQGYNESLTTITSVQGVNTSLLNFSLYTNPVSEGNPNSNLSLYNATFTPRKADLFNNQSMTYNVTFNVTDKYGLKDSFTFKLNLLAINNTPVLMNLVNLTSYVNGSIYYDINASDVEDGVDPGLLTFSYRFLSGNDFINNNQSIFSNYTGILNMTFNQSQAGKYRVNITVTDSSGLNDSKDFWIYVYGPINVTSPASSRAFNLTEGNQSGLIFNANHSVGDNLTFSFYLNNVLRYNVSYYGNNSNLTWNFTPSYDDESYGDYSNLSLFVYNGIYPFLNYSTNWSANISHANSPIVSLGNISNPSSAAYGTPITIDLKNYFYDADYFDSHYNTGVGFNVSSNVSTGISWSVSSNWILSLTASSALSEYLNVTLNNSVNNLTSNNFQVQFTTPESSGDTGSHGGGGSSGGVTKVSLKVLLPDGIVTDRKDNYSLLVMVLNDGGVRMSNIDIDASVSKNGLNVSDVTYNLDTKFIPSLDPGKSVNLTLNVGVNTDYDGVYEIKVAALARTPIYGAEGKTYLTVKQGKAVEDHFIFTQELIIGNPVCAEVKELVDEAKIRLDQKDFSGAEEKLNEAVDGCRKLISENRMTAVGNSKYNLWGYLSIAVLASILVGILYYTYQRRRLIVN